MGGPWTLDAELRLLATAAEMERQRDDRHMTTPIAHCAHCQRPAPAEDDPDCLHWEVLDDSDMVCPDCETLEEKQAIDEKEMRLADEADNAPHKPRSD